MSEIYEQKLTQLRNTSTPSGKDFIFQIWDHC